MLNTVCDRWWVLFLRGIAAVLLGIVAIVMPGITLLALVFVFGAYSLIDGAASIALGIRGEADGTVWWTMVLLGVLAAIAGIMAFAWPGLTLFVLLVIIGVSAIMRGILEIIAAIRLHKHIDDEWILGLSGLLSIIFGAMILYRPGIGLLAIALLIGAYMVAIGSLAIGLSLRLRKIGAKRGVTAAAV
jgi:uncharacterized membrane protein HdeD (DUF308 family)